MTRSIGRSSNALAASGTTSSGETMIILGVVSDQLGHRRRIDHGCDRVLGTEGIVQAGASADRINLVGARRADRDGCDVFGFGSFNRIELNGGSPVAESNGRFVDRFVKSDGDQSFGPDQRLQVAMLGFLDPVGELRITGKLQVAYETIRHEDVAGASTRAKA